MKLVDLNVGETAKVLKINSSLEMTKRLNDLGFFENVDIKCMLTGPFKRIKAYLINDTLLAIRDKDALNIEVTIND